MNTFFESMKKFRVLWIFVIVFTILIVIANQMRREKENIVYPEALDVVVATVEGKEFTLRDFAVYVAHQEAEVQNQAYAYDMDNTKRYWNVRTDMGFISQVARNEAMSMAIHDELFYQLYQKLNMQFSEKELEMIQNNAEDFWNDLVDEDKDVRLGIGKEDVYNTMYKIACSQKAQMVYAGILAVDYEDLDYASEEFLDFLADYEYKVNDKVLNRLDFGDITLVHE